MYIFFHYYFIKVKLVCALAVINLALVHTLRASILIPSVSGQRGAHELAAHNNKQNILKWNRYEIRPAELMEKNTK